MWFFCQANKQNCVSLHTNKHCKPDSNTLLSSFIRPIHTWKLFFDIYILVHWSASIQYRLRSDMPLSFWHNHYMTNVICNWGKGRLNRHYVKEDFYTDLITPPSPTASLSKNTNVLRIFEYSFASEKKQDARRPVITRYLLALKHSLGPVFFLVYENLK